MEYGQRILQWYFIFLYRWKIFPQNIVTATLNYEIQQLKEKLKNLVDDEVLYNMQKDKAFGILYNMTFPGNTDIDNDY